MAYKDKDKEKTTRAEYYVAHKEELREKGRDSARAWEAKHREERNAQCRAYHARHKEERKAYSKAYRLAHREEIKAQSGANYFANHERYKAQNRAWYAAHRTEKKYGMSLEDWNKLFDLQKGKCRICKNKMTVKKGKRTVCVDHCHGKSGHVRGLICHACNVSEGLLGTPEVVLSLYKYMMENELLSYQPGPN